MSAIVGTFSTIWLKFWRYLMPLSQNNFRPAFFQGRFLSYLIAVIIAIKIITVGLSIPFPQNWFFADITKIDLVHLLNNQRQELGLGTLRESEALNQAAMLKAQDMMANGYFAHQSPSGITPWFWLKKVGYAYAYAGENLAVGFIDSNTVYSAWVNSPSHNANLVNPNYQEVGSAVVQGFGDSNAILVVQLFGSPLEKSIKPSTSQSVEQKEQRTPVLAQTAQESESTATVQSQKTSSNEQNVPAQTSQETTQSGQSDGEQVLAQTSEYVLEKTPEKGFANAVYAKLAYVLIYENGLALKYATYALLLIIMTTLLLSIFMSPKAPDSKLALRGVTMMAVLYGSFFIDKDIVSQFFWHYIIL